MLHVIDERNYITNSKFISCKNSPCCSRQNNENKQKLYPPTKCKRSQNIDPNSDSSTQSITFELSDCWLHAPAYIDHKHWLSVTEFKMTIY